MASDGIERLSDIARPNSQEFDWGAMYLRWLTKRKDKMTTFGVGQFVELVSDDWTEARAVACVISASELIAGHGKRLTWS